MQTINQSHSFPSTGNFINIHLRGIFDLSSFLKMFCAQKKAMSQCWLTTHTLDEEGRPDYSQTEDDPRPEKSCNGIPQLLGKYKSSTLFDQVVKIHSKSSVEWKPKSKKNPTSLGWVRFFNSLKIKTCISDSDFFLQKMAEQRRGHRKMMNIHFSSVKMLPERKLFISFSKLPWCVQHYTKDCASFFSTVCYAVSNRVHYWCPANLLYPVNPCWTKEYKANILPCKNH